MQKSGKILWEGGRKDTLAPVVSTLRGRALPSPPPPPIPTPMAAAVVAVVAADELPAKRRKREMWVQPMLQCRQQVGAYNMLMAELRSDDIDMYEDFTRMSPEQFDELLDLVRNEITKSCQWRMPVSAEIRLAVHPWRNFSINKGNFYSIV